MKDPDIVLDPVLVVRLKEDIPLSSPVAEKTPLDIIWEGIRNYGREPDTHHCNNCGHDFTLIRENDGDRYLPEFCPMCLSDDIEKFRE